MFLASGILVGVLEPLKCEIDLVVGCSTLALSLSLSLSIYSSLSFPLFLSLCVHPSVDLSVCRSIYLSIYLSTNLSIYLPIIYLSIDRSINLSIYVSPYRDLSQCGIPNHVQNTLVQRLEILRTSVLKYNTPVSKKPLQKKFVNKFEDQSGWVNEGVGQIDPSAQRLTDAQTWLSVCTLVGTQSTQGLSATDSCRTRQVLAQSLQPPPDELRKSSG